MRTPGRIGLLEILLGLTGMAMVIGVLAAQERFNHETAEAISMSQAHAGN